jgi:lysozyme
MNTLQTSPAGRGFIEGREGLELVPYRDESRFWTVGFGHKITDPAVLARLDAGEPPSTFALASRDAADQIMSNDLRVAESAVNSRVTVEIAQHQFDALVSFAFNVGTGQEGFSGSTLLRLLNAGDFEGAADEFPKWCHDVVDGVKVVSQNLRARRNLERAMFLGPDMPAA